MSRGAPGWAAEDYDVLVIGGGLAGSTAAAYCAMQGHKTLVLERETGPRHRVGESLLPSMMPILEDFGMIEEVEAMGFRHKTGGTFIWGKTDEPWDVLFSNNPFLPYPYAFHVDRAVFDDMLLQNAKRKGAQVEQGINVTGPVLDGERVVGVRFQAEKKGPEFEVRSRYVLDSSGPDAVLAKTLTGRTYDEKMRQVAFYAYYRDVKGPEGYREGHVLIESNPWGWFWYIPMDGKQLGEASVGLVSGQEYKDEYRKMGIEAFYERALEKSPFIKSLLGPNYRRITEMSAIKDWAYQSDRTAGPGFYLAGDAAVFLDPLLSSGGTMAMLAGYSASVCLNTALHNPESEADAVNFYDSNYRRMWEVTRDFLHYFYAGNLSKHSEDMFWKARSMLNLGENVGAAQAFCFLVNTIPANPHPALKKQIHMYMQFMDQLEHPMDAMGSCDTLQDKVKAFEERRIVEGQALRDELVPVLNGELDTAFSINGDTHSLEPIRGVTYDHDRPVFSSTSSWLLGRNIHPLDDSSWALVSALDGERSWKEILEAEAKRTGQSTEDVRKELTPRMQDLCADRLVLLEEPVSAAG